MNPDLSLRVARLWAERDIPQGLADQLYLGGNSALVEQLEQATDAQVTEVVRLWEQSQNAMTRLGQAASVRLRLEPADSWAFLPSPPMPWWGRWPWVILQMLAVVALSVLVVVIW